MPTEGKLAMLEFAECEGLKSHLIHLQIDGNTFCYRVQLLYMFIDTILKTGLQAAFMLKILLSISVAYWMYYVLWNVFYSL